jgi:hypothetical protein
MGSRFFQGDTDLARKNAPENMSNAAFSNAFFGCHLPGVAIDAPEVPAGEIVAGNSQL